MPLIKRVIRTLYTLVFGLVVCFVLYRTLRPNTGSRSQRAADERWIATSHSWLDRWACRWIGICGGTNWLGQTWIFRSRPLDREWPDEKLVFDSGWHFNESRDVQNSPNWSLEELFLREIPPHVLAYAPLVYLHPKEPYWPSDLVQHLENVVPMYQDSPISNFTLHLGNLSLLNGFGGGEDVSLTSRDNIQDTPPWLISKHSIPLAYEANPEELIVIANDTANEKALANEKAKKEGWYSAEPPRSRARLPPPGYTPDWRSSQEDGSTSKGGYSPAPAVLIVVGKENDICDAFWFYFNSFDQGNKVIGIRFGNHVGDWEHSMVRFHRGEPKAIFTSRHSFGSSAYSYEAVEKMGKRPILYAARGTHAMYVTAGIQAYKLPFNMLHDTTARGPLWDPILGSLKAYTYDLTSDTLRASLLNPKEPTSWFYFRGRWGDRAYDLGDHRQYRFAGEYHYSSGPNGPKFKNLGRRTVCENEKHECEIRKSIH